MASKGADRGGHGGDRYGDRGGRGGYGGPGGRDRGPPNDRYGGPPRGDFGGNRFDESMFDKYIKIKIVLIFVNFQIFINFFYSLQKILYKDGSIDFNFSALLNFEALFVKE